MKNTITILSFLLISNFTFSQNHYFGVKGGVNFINVTKYIVEPDKRVCFNSGITYEYRMNDKIIFGIDLLYDQRGYKTNLYFTDMNGVPTGQYLTSSYNNDYIALPLKVGLTEGEVVSFHTNIGVTPAMVVSSKLKTEAYENYFGATVSDLKNVITNFDLSVNLEFGLGVRIKESNILYTSISGQKSLINISNENYFNGYNIKHYGLSISIGLKRLL